MTTGQTPNFALNLPDFRMGPWHDLVNDNFTKVDQILYGALSKVDTPLWANNTHYVVGFTTLDGASGATYMNTIDHTTPTTGTFAAERAAHPTYWTQLLAGFAPRGEWAHNTTYFPYDLAYQTNTGTLGLCKTLHVSNASGIMKDDAAYWSFIYDFSATVLTTALTISYDPAASGLGVTNVQAAIDKLETQIVGINSVNVTQGNTLTTQAGQITALQNTDATYASRMTTIEGVNTTQAGQITALQNTDVSLQNQITAISSSFPSGTRILFFQSVPPSGWTIVAGLGDRAIRIVSDASGGSSGGSYGFSTIFGRSLTDTHAITITEMPAHHHNYTSYYSSNTQYVQGPGGVIYDFTTAANDSDVGGNQAHSHGCEMRVAYINCIVGNKT